MSVTDRELSAQLPGEDPHIDADFFDNPDYREWIASIHQQNQDALDLIPGIPTL